MNLPDIKNIFEVIYRYKDREYYLEGDDLKEFFAQLGSASIMAVTHGATFKPLEWKVRKLK